MTCDEFARKSFSEMIFAEVSANWPNEKLERAGSWLLARPLPWIGEEFRDDFNKQPFLRV